MNIVFWLIIAIAVVALWFLLSFSFKGIGSFFKRLFDDAAKAMKDDDNKKENNIER